jgi:hypothetical protein
MTTKTRKFSRTIHSSSQEHIGVVTVLESDSGQDISTGVYARIKSTNLSADTLKSIILFPEDVKALRIALQALEAHSASLTADVTYTNPHLVRLSDTGEMV